MRKEKPLVSEDSWMVEMEIKFVTDFELYRKRLENEKRRYKS